MVKEAPKVEVVQAPKVEVTTTSSASYSSSLDIDALLAKYRYTPSSYTPAVTTTDYQVVKKTSVSVQFALMHILLNSRNVILPIVWIIHLRF